MTRFCSAGEKLLPFFGRLRQIVAAREFASKLSRTSSAMSWVSPRMIGRVESSRRGNYPATFVDILSSPVWLVRLPANAQHHRHRLR